MINKNSPLLNLNGKQLQTSTRKMLLNKNTKSKNFKDIKKDLIGLNENNFIKDYMPLNNIALSIDDSLQIDN